eukprot:3933495-Rhodomonas_salina.2
MAAGSPEPEAACPKTAARLPYVEADSGNEGTGCIIGGKPGGFLGKGSIRCCIPSQPAHRITITPSPSHVRTARCNQTTTSTRVSGLDILHSAHCNQTA